MPSLPESSPQIRTGCWPAAYKLIDGWRALAAVVVVCHHLGVGTNWNIGYIAVLLFFVISGYCIAATSESCVRKGHGFGTYVRRRVRRIYPPYLFAVLFFVVSRIAKSMLGMPQQLSTSIVAWIQTLTLTQWLSLVRHPIPYAAENRTLFVAAFWSLNYEEQFYLVIGALMLVSTRLGWPMLRGVLVLMVGAFAWNLTHPGISYGFFLEYWVHFSLGVIVYYRLVAMTSTEGRRAADIGLSALFLGSTITWVLSRTDIAQQRYVYAEWSITSAFALLLIGMRTLDGPLSRTWPGRRLMAIGTITYSLYLVHQFNLGLAGSVAQRFIAIGLPKALEVPIELLALLAVAFAFWYVCERRFLNRPLEAAEPKPVSPLAR